MPDLISPAERSLIDAALASGRVRHIPRGVSGIPDGLTGETWSRQFGARVAMFDAARRRAQTNRAAAGPAQCDATDHKILGWLREGKTQADIKRTLGVTSAAVSWRVQRLRTAGLLEGKKRDMRSIKEMAEEIRPDLERLVAQGLSTSEIGTALGLGKEQVRERLTALGLRTAPRSGPRARAAA